MNIDKKITSIQIGESTIGVDELVNYKTAGKILGLSPRSVQDMGVKRELPLFKLSTRVTRYRVSDLLEWIENRNNIMKNESK